MSTLEENPELIRCEDEPIRIPSYTQGFGVLMILDKSNLNILQVSSNIEAFSAYKAEQILNKKVEILLNNFPLQEKIASLKESGNKIREKIEAFGQLKSRFFLSYYLWGPFIYLEIERDLASPASKQTRDFGFFLGQYFQGIDQGQDLVKILQYTTQHLKSYLGFHRVMIYQFDPDWNGSVVAEACEHILEPLLGLHYPASDIPAQARELYKENWIRLIADVSASSYELSPTINPLTGNKPDLGLVAMRSVSPIHIEYLINMGVKASFSLSILYQGQLWGLIACHHQAPFYLSPVTRQHAELFAKIFSNYLEVRLQKEEIEQSKVYAEHEVKLIDRLTQESSDFSKALLDSQDYLQKVNSATGGAYFFDNTISLFGQTPPQEDVGKLIAWIFRHVPQSVFYTHKMSSYLELSEEGTQKMSGVLAIRLAPQSPEMILWFKPEKIQTVYWAGDREKATVLDEKEGKLRLKPRKSFAKWKETLAGQAEYWQKGEIEIAKRLRQQIFDLVFKVLQTLEINRQLEDINEELNAFNYTVSHDLKQPIRNIENYSAILLEDYKDQLDEEGFFMLQTINENINTLNQIINNLLEYSRLSRSNNERVFLKMAKLIREVFKSIAHPQGKPIDLQVQEDLPKMYGDTILMKHVILNILDNAVKYSQHKEKSIIRVRGSQDPNHTYYVFSDNGIGIPQEQREKVFQIFFRLHHEDQYEGSGLGLAIVQRITSRHKGRVWIEGNTWGGTDVHFAFPKSKDNLENTAEI